MGTSLVFASGKGGVGKTQTVINLGTALAQHGHNVTIVEGNLITPNLAIYFGIPLHAKTLNDIIRGDASIDEATYVHEETGLLLIPANIQLHAHNDISSRALRNTIRDIKKHTDTVIVDCVSSLGDEVSEIIKSADKAVIVTNPELPAMADAYKTIRLTRHLGTQVAGVVVTRTGRFKGELSDDEINTLLEGTQVIGKIPEDHRVPMASSRSEPVVLAYPHSRASRAYKRLASSMLGKEYSEFGFAEDVLNSLQP
ncbi:Iron-sulfur cluster carrier protein [Candidatus Norongarragalina meridionalis]|nr:Iron-sulfur cluster carrier protein [Candidatus Norongarragalina meridionalis]